MVKAFDLQADGLGFNFPSGYKVDHPGHSKYVWVEQYEPNCLKINSNNKPNKILQIGLTESWVSGFMIGFFILWNCAMAL